MPPRRLQEEQRGPRHPTRLRRRSRRLRRRIDLLRDCAFFIFSLPRAGLLMPVGQKHALRGFTVALMKELVNTPIRVTEVQPGTSLLMPIPAYRSPSIRSHRYGRNMYVPPPTRPHMLLTRLVQHSPSPGSAGTQIRPRACTRGSSRSSRRMWRRISCGLLVGRSMCTFAFLPLFVLFYRPCGVNVG
jgi:hypothetical protein